MSIEDKEKFITNFARVLHDTFREAEAADLEFETSEEKEVRGMAWEYFEEDQKYWKCVALKALNYLAEYNP